MAACKLHYALLGLPRPGCTNSIVTSVKSKEALTSSLSAGTQNVVDEF